VRRETSCPKIDKALGPDYLNPVIIIIIIIIIASYKPCTSGTMVPAATVPFIDVNGGCR
jgi:hypothetical protein